MILVRTISIFLSNLVIISKFSLLGMVGGWEIFKLLEFWRGGKFSGLRVGLCWMEAGLTGIANSSGWMLLWCQQRKFLLWQCWKLLNFELGQVFWSYVVFFKHPRQFATWLKPQFTYLTQILDQLSRLPFFTLFVHKLGQMRIPKHFLFQKSRVFMGKWNMLFQCKRKYTYKFYMFTVKCIKKKRF